MAHKKTHFDYDIIVIGSGAAGSIASTVLAKEGKKVALIEQDTFGGDSPNYSDIPTKALLHTAQLFDEAKNGARFGLRSSMLGYNYPTLLNWKDLAVRRTGANNNRTFYERQGIVPIQGTAHFLSPHEITVNRRHLAAEKFIVATGSTWTAPAITGLDTVNWLTPTTILSLTRPPKSLFIVGGNSTAVELAQLFATFGTKVYISEQAERLLPGEDAEVGDTLAELLAKHKGVTTITHSTVVFAEKDGLMKRVVFSRGGVEKSVRVDELLIASQRTPSTDLGLENATVEASRNGVEVDEYLQTSAKHIFAAGDVLGTNSVTHQAILEGRIAAHNILHPKNRTKIDYRAMPRVTFTYPGVASVGLSEDDCLKRDLRIKKSLVPLSIIARSNTSDFRDGFVKLIANQHEVIIGATVVAPHAGEIIHELALAVRHGLTANDVATTPHAFLSWSEAVRVAATRLLG